MIKGVHTMFFSSDPEQTRAFLRDKLGFAAADVGGGWLIFQLPEADMGVHPVHGDKGPAGTHNISFYCDDLEATVAQLEERGVQFKGKIEEASYGRITHFAIPGEIEVQPYQPFYKTDF